MSADEETIQDNNLGQSSLESILQEKEKSELTPRERNGSRASHNNDNRGTVIVTLSSSILNCNPKSWFL